MGQGRGSGVEAKGLVVIHRSHHVTAAVQGVVVVCVQALAFVHPGKVAGGDGGIHQVASPFVKDICVGSCVADGAQDGLGVGGGGIAVVVTQHHAGVIGIGTHHGNGDAILLERQHVVLVLEEHDGFPGGLGGQGGVGGAAQLLFTQLGPGELFGRVEHTQLETGFQDASEVHVNLGFRDETLLNGFGEGFEAGAAFHVRAGKDGIGRCAGGVRMGAVLAGVVEVTDGAAVRHNQAAEAPLVAEDVREEPVAAAAGISLIALVCAHHFLDVAVLHNLAEGGEVGLPKVPHGDGYVKAVPVGLRAAVNGKMLGAGVQLEVFLVRSLHGQHGLGAHYGVEERVLAGGLLAASPAGIPENVHIGAPEGEAVVPDVAVGLRYAHLVVVRGIPDGPCLIRHGGVNLILLGGIESGAQGNHLREDGNVVVADAVTGLVPPVVGGDAQPVHGDGAVHHKADFLFRREQGHKVVHPLVQGEPGILERIVVVLAPDGQ